MGIFGDIIDSVTGKGSAKAAEKASDAQVEVQREALAQEKEAAELARSDLAPFAEAGQGALSKLAAGIDAPRGDFRSSDDTFDVASGVLNDDIAARAAAAGKLGSGQTLNDIFSRNALLRRDLDIQDENVAEGRRGSDINSLMNLTNIGQASAAGQANTALTSSGRASNLLTGIGNSQAAGTIGKQNAQNAGGANLISLAALAFSDRRLKRNITRQGEHNGIPVYSYQYLWSDDWFTGVMADDVPHARFKVGDFWAVDYGAL